jgi:hypothetical protein
MFSAGYLANDESSDEKTFKEIAERDKRKIIVFMVMLCLLRGLI